MPLSEKQSLKSKGDAYRAYQQKTSKFFPWFSKVGVLLIVMGVGHALATPWPDRIAKIYPIGKSSAAPSFIQKTHYIENKDGSIEADTRIVDEKGSPVLNETAIYRGSSLILPLDLLVRDFWPRIGTS